MNYHTLLNSYDIKLRNIHTNMNKNDFCRYYRSCIPYTNSIVVMLLRALLQISSEQEFLRAHVKGVAVGTIVSNQVCSVHSAIT